MRANESAHYQSVGAGARHATSESETNACSLDSGSRTQGAGLCQFNDTRLHGAEHEPPAALQKWKPELGEPESSVTGSRPAWPLPWREAFPFPRGCKQTPPLLWRDSGHDPLMAFTTEGGPGMKVRASALRREETGETHVSQRQLGKRTGALCLGIGRLGIAKMSVLPKMNCQFNTTPTKIPTGFFLLESDKLILKFIWNCKRLRNSTNYIEK